MDDLLMAFCIRNPALSILILRAFSTRARGLARKTKKLGQLDIAAQPEFRAAAII